ncbi:ionotropic receptor 40a isoform X2 [Bacillus rossius redtenbacheri]|uniref:ionotropic receptor 40a isoform X2 n=1 Tax=Bacillus rossius redtenbacheri TaxID=93214 RepID=UPI002FDEB356
MIVLSARALFQPDVCASETSPLELEMFSALLDIFIWLPTGHVTIVCDEHVDTQFPGLLSRRLHNFSIVTRSYNIIQQERHNETFYRFVKDVILKHEESVNLIFCSLETAEDLIEEIRENNLITRNVLYMFYLRSWPPSRRFTDGLLEAMRVVVITRPRDGVYRVYYNQAASGSRSQFTLVNWWSAATRKLHRRPVLPPAVSVYNNFHGREFLVPVLNKPPWYFVAYENDTMVSVEGGRDDQLLELLADKLNFRYEYFDPPDRSQGSAITKNGTFPGVLGLIWMREVEFFLGDVTVTYERSQAVEFSFFTLADSGAFVTRAPGRLNEALALVRPFQWQQARSTVSERGELSTPDGTAGPSVQVWPPVIATVVLSGPILFAVVEAPTLWWPGRRDPRRRRKLLWDSMWFVTTICFRQSREVSTSHKARLITILLTFATTYIIGDMYSANLTSLLARPGREAPINTLAKLERAMKEDGYQLLVESHSSSYGILENGTGIYKKLWRMMSHQPYALISSVQNGMPLVRANKKYVLLGGRETLYFDAHRFGAQHFHLSEKLYTRYSAIALQIGCPFLENVNKILMQLFEAGIVTKITESEYRKLGEKLRATQGVPGEAGKQGLSGEAGKQDGDPTKGSAASSTAEEQLLRPITMTMLQGAFLVLLMGYTLSGLSFWCETWTNRLQPYHWGCEPRTRLHLNPKACERCWALCSATWEEFVPPSPMGSSASWLGQPYLE